MVIIIIIIIRKKGPGVTSALRSLLRARFACTVGLNSQVQLMRGEFLETALYWAGVVFVRLGAIAERR